MKTNHDYRSEALELVGALMCEAIDITGAGQFHVHVDYSGHVDRVDLSVYRASCDNGWQQDRHQVLIKEYRRLSPYDPDDRDRAREHWLGTLSTLRDWHRQLQQLKQATAA